MNNRFSCFGIFKIDNMNDYRKTELNHKLYSTCNKDPKMLPIKFRKCDRWGT